MAHNLDITNGHASFAARQDAWHHLGQNVGHAMNAREAMHAANLAGWNVRKVPMVIPAPLGPDGSAIGNPVPVTNRYATVRDNPVTGKMDYLGVVGETYTPFQNEKSCDLLDALVGESGAHFETAGALDGGRQTFLTMQLPTSMVFDGKDGSSDETRWYIAALNSHDGSSAFRFLITCVRIVCANTQAAALRGAKASFSIRHTGNGNGLIAAARSALKLSFTYMSEFEQEAAALFAQEMSDEQAQAFSIKLFNVDGAASMAAANNRRQHANQVYNLFRNSPTNTAIAGTRWAAYNAVTEYVDHVQRVGRTRGGRAAQDIRALRTLTSSTAQGLKTNAFAALQAA